ncbi:hypothetical protein ACQKWADRAFT_314802 [Trichoderma austrokoningii]
MSNSTTISEATNVCLQSFINYDEVLKDEWSETRLAEFRCWIYDLDVLADGRASLDYRLRDKPETRSFIANFLHLLTGLVDDCKSLSQLKSSDQPMQFADKTPGCTELSEPVDDNDSGRDSITSPEIPPERPSSPGPDDSMSDDSASGRQLDKQPEPPSSSDPLPQSDGHASTQGYRKQINYSGQKIMKTCRII